MNVLHITRRFYPFVGGVEKYIYEISKRLVKRGIDCRVLTLNYDLFNKKKKLNQYGEIEGIKIFRIPGFGHYKKPVPLKIPLCLFKWADIVHIHDLRFLYETTLFLKSFFNYKIIYSTHGFLLHTKDIKAIKSLMIPHYYKSTINRFIENTICVSKQDYNYFEAQNFKNICLIENGIDFEKFNRITRKPQVGRFLYFGRIDTNKGLDLLFKAISLMEDGDWHLDIIGDGFPHLLAQLKKMTHELNISKKITWHGFVKEDGLFQFISRAQICLLPSTYEGFGFTLLEAMAGGCVCVANIIPAYKDIIKDSQNGFLTDFKDPHKAVLRIKEIIKLPLEKVETIGNNAHAKAKNYDWEEKVKQILGGYKLWTKNLNLPE